MISEKSKAIKLADELGQKVDRQSTDANYWKEQLQELTQEKKYNQLVDEFKIAKAKIFAKRNFKAVVKDIQQHKRKRIELAIPVKKTDPPTVDKNDIAEQIGDINFWNYSIAFSVTVMKQNLDESGFLLNEVETTTPEEPIKHASFLKKYEKRTAGALAGFLNNYMKKLAKSLVWVKRVNLILSKKVQNPVALTPNFDGMQMNCLIQVVDSALQKRKDYKKTLRGILKQINDDYFETGVTETAIDLLCSKLKINIHVVSILQKTWYHKHTGDTRLTVLVCSHNGHATVYRDTKDMTDFLKPVKNAKATTTYTTDVFQKFIDDPSPIKFPILIKDNIVAYFTYEGNSFKNKDIFFDDDDWSMNGSNEDLYGVFTLTSRYYKMFKKKYDLQDFYRDEDLYHFVKCADQYTPPWCTEDV